MQHIYTAYSFCLNRAIHPRYAALTSEEESQTERAKKGLDNLYQKIRGSVDEVALNIRNTLQSPRYKELIFYLLMSNNSWSQTTFNNSYNYSHMLLSDTDSDIRHILRK